MIEKIAYAAALAAALSFASCNMAFMDASNVTRAKDAIPPTISISSPGDGFQCANIVEATGTVSDLADGSAPGKVETLSYSIPGSTVQGSAAVNADGSFVFQFETATLGAAFVLTITAQDWNGNTGSTSVNLQKTTGDSLPSFTATASNKKVILNWDEVPHTESYTLYYSSNGSLPSDTAGTMVQHATAPFSLPCENGKLYTFRLKASAEAGWTDSLSSYVKTIPLSERTLVPRAFGKRGKITIEWNGIDATDEFTVFRRIGETGTFDEFRTTTGTTFTDTTAQNGQRYYYKVKPSSYSDTLSGSVGGETDGFNVSPSVAQSFALSAAAVRDMCVDGDYLYGASLTQGMVIFQSTDPYEPTKVAAKAPPNKQVYQVAVSGGYAYAAAGADGLYVYDVSNPKAPLLAGSYSEGFGCARGIAVSGGYVLVVDFVSTSTGGNYGWEAVYDCSVKVFDVSVPSSPTLAASFALDESTAYSYGLPSYGDSGPIEIAVSGNYTYVAGEAGGMRVVQWTDGVSPAGGAGPVAAVVPPVAEGNLGSAHACSVALGENYAYVAVNEFGVMVVDISTPETPAILRYDSYDANGRVWDVAVAGDWLFTMSLDLGVQIFRLDDPAVPKRQRNIPVTYANILSVAGSVAYAFSDCYYPVAQYAVDLNLPLGLESAASIATEGTCRDVVVDGGYAYVADGAAGLRIFDVADPSAPAQISTATKDGYTANMVKVSGGLAFVLFDSDWEYLRIYDVSEPSAPVLLSETFKPYLRGFAVSGGYLYTTNYHEGFQVYDINDPSAPLLVKSIDASGDIDDVAISGNYAFVADGTQGAVAYDISDPLNSFLVGTVSMEGCERLAATEAALFTANYFDNSTICDIADPSSPQWITDIETSPRLGIGVAATGNYAFASSVSNDMYRNLSIQIVEVSKLSSPLTIADLGAGTLVSDIYANGLAASGPYLYLAAGNELRIFKIRP